VIDVVSKGYTIDGKPFRYPKIILGEWWLKISTTYHSKKNWIIHFFEMD
jgi:hypothetical protein